MAFVHFDGIKVVTETEGDGDLELGDAVGRFSGTAGRLADGDTAIFAVHHADDAFTEWEVFVGTYHVGDPITVTRSLVLSNSEGTTTAIALSAGTKHVSLVAAAVHLRGGLAHAPPQGRLTLESGVPISTSDQLAKGLVYFTPHQGNQVWLYNGYFWEPHSLSSEISNSPPGDADTNHDWYLFNNAGTLELESVNWTNDTTPASRALQDGRWVKSGEPEKLLVGWGRTTDADTTEDSEVKRYLGNLYHQVPRRLHYAIEDSHAYGSTTFRAYNDDSSHKVSLVLGLPQVVTWIVQGQWSDVTAGSEAGYAAVGVNSTTTVSGLAASISLSSRANAGSSNLLAAGLNDLQLLEAAAGTVTMGQYTINLAALM